MILERLSMFLIWMSKAILSRPNQNIYISAFFIRSHRLEMDKFSIRFFETACARAQTSARVGRLFVMLALDN